MTERQLQGYTEITVGQKEIASLGISINIFQNKVRRNIPIYAIPILNPPICICHLMIQVCEKPMIGSMKILIFTFTRIPLTFSIALVYAMKIF